MEIRLPAAARGTELEPRYWQNCAARGLCDTLFHLRTDAAVHQAPAGREVRRGPAGPKRSGPASRARDDRNMIEGRVASKAILKPWSWKPRA